MQVALDTICGAICIKPETCCPWTKTASQVLKTMLELLHHLAAKVDPKSFFSSSFDDFILLDTFNVVFPLYSNPDAKLPYIQCLLHKMDFLPSLQKEIRVVVIIGVLCLHIQDKS